MECGGVSLISISTGAITFVTIFVSIVGAEIALRLIAVFSLAIVALQLISSVFSFLIRQCKRSL